MYLLISFCFQSSSQVPQESYSLQTWFNHIILCLFQPRFSAGWHRVQGPP